MQELGDPAGVGVVVRVMRSRGGVWSVVRDRCGLRGVVKGCGGVGRVMVGMVVRLGGW